MDEVEYIDEQWNKKKYGEVPRMRQLKFRYGKYKNTTWVETLHKHDNDRIWFYDEFVPFVRVLSDVVGVRILDNQVPSNDRIGWYLPDRIVGYLVEVLIQKEVGFVWAEWN